MLIPGKEFWALKATHGLPLDFIVDELVSRNIYPKWDEVFLAAKADGTDLAKLARDLAALFMGHRDEAAFCSGFVRLRDRFSK